MKKINLSIYSFITILLYISIFKIYCIPDSIRQFMKIGTLILVFVFLFSKVEKKKLFNVSLLFCASIMISAFLALFHKIYNFKAFLDSVLYCFTFYNLYVFIALSRQKSKYDTVSKTFYIMTLLYCILTIGSVLIVGVENNSNNAAYIFGNKFTSSYYFLLLVSLFPATHDIKRKINQVVELLFFMISIIFCLYIGCSTATITLFILFIYYLLPNRIKNSIITPKNVTISLIICWLSVLFMSQLLEFKFINNLIFNYFDKSYTVNGRLQIYSKYLPKVIFGSFLAGYGYSSDIMLKMTSGIFGNAQNGLFQIMVNFGFIGVCAVIYTLYYCYNKAEKNENSLYLSMIVLGMIIASIFEVTINWFFFLGIFLIRWNKDCERK